MVSIRDISKNEKHKKINTIRVENKFAGFPSYVKNYRIKQDKIVIPRIYAFKRLKWTPTLKKFKIHASLEKFNGSLRDYQIKIFEDTVQQFKKFPGVILSMFTGSGKTYLALRLISLFKLKTIVIVNKELLLDQWVDQIKTLIPSAKIGRIQGKIFDVDDADIVIGMLQTVSKGKRSVSDYKQFDFAVYDECHNINATQFSDVLFLIPSFYQLGLSATPTRSDGLHVIAESHIGPVRIYENNDKLVPSIHVYKCPKINIEQEIMKNGKTNISKITTDVSLDDTANAFIVSIVEKYLLDKHSILVLTNRIHQCKTLCKMLNNPNASFLAGKMTNDKRNEALKANIIFSTYSMFSEGIDKPSLSCLVLAASKVNITQAVGRILRRRNISSPVVVDIQYTDSILMSQYYRRSRWYRSCKYAIQHKSIESDFK